MWAMVPPQTTGIPTRDHALCTLRIYRSDLLGGLTSRIRTRSLTAFVHPKRGQRLACGVPTVASRERRTRAAKDGGSSLALSRSVVVREAEPHGGRRTPGASVCSAP